MDIGLKREAQAVKALGESIGYGNMMSMASALWRKDMIENGYPVSGVFVPVLPSDVKEEYLNEGDMKKYDSIVNEAT